jgi:ribosomal protein L18E
MNYVKAGSLQKALNVKSQIRPIVKLLKLDFIREPPSNDQIHKTVFQRLALPKSNYRPTNLSKFVSGNEESDSVLD